MYWHTILSLSPDLTSHLFFIIMTFIYNPDIFVLIEFEYNVSLIVTDINLFQAQDHPIADLSLISKLQLSLQTYKLIYVLQLLVHCTS